VQDAAGADELAFPVRGVADRGVDLILL